jgi:D-alanyl-D-alanine carboxypeptidase (penicillin-binding protein 5/6)
LLIPSANNIADLLARWDAGSTTTFVAEMNATAAQMGLRHTHYADPSGYDPGTISTAVDQTKLAEYAIGIPTLITIANLRQVNLPRVGAVRITTRCSELTVSSA